MRPVRRALRGLLALAAMGCRPDERTAVPPGSRGAPLPPAAVAASEQGPLVTDLLDAFARGSIDTDGPVVDLGEAQSANYVYGAAPLRTETLQGDSWAGVGSRLSLRVPIDHGGGDDDALDRPASVRVRVRRATGRSVALVVDGLLTRAARLPPAGAAGVLDLPVPADRFTRSPVEIELRFTGPRPAPGAPPHAVVEVDWVHLARSDATPTVVASLLNDVTLGGPPRRALAFHPPTVLGVTRVLPPRAVFRASLGAEAPHGASRAPQPLPVRVRVELDGEGALEQRVDVVPNAPWTDVSLDLSRWAGRAARITVGAPGVAGVRLALASPRFEAPRTEAAHAPPPVQVVLVVLRGLRPDRLWPELSAHLSAGGFARLLREGLWAEATAPTMRPWAALTSATTGLPADVHRVVETTDLLSEDAPTLATDLVAHGVRVDCFSDEPLWFGSGADRGCATRWSCGDHPGCRTDATLAAVADAVAHERSGPRLALVVSRMGSFPLDPAPEQVTALDATPYEGTLTPAQTRVLADRAHHGEVRLEARDQDRLNLLYDATLRAADAGLAHLLQRISDVHGEGRTLVVVVGDRGVPLGERHAVWEGTMAQREARTTALLVWGAATVPGRVVAPLGVVDGAATVLEALGLEVPAEFEGRSARVPAAFHDRAFTVEGDLRGALGVRFDGLLALPRPMALGGGLSLLAVDDPDGEDAGALRPVARALAWQSLAQASTAAGRRVFRPSTRVIAP